MATVTPSTHLDHQAPSNATSDPMSIDNSLNGTAVPQFAPTPPRTDEQEQEHARPPAKQDPVSDAPTDRMTPPQSASDAPSNVQSGLTPMAPYVAEAISHPVPPVDNQPNDLPPPSDIPPVAAPAHETTSAMDISAITDPEPIKAERDAPDVAAGDTKPTNALGQADASESSQPPEPVPVPTFNAPITNGISATEPVQPESQVPEHDMLDVSQPTSKLVREREDDDEYDHLAKRARTDGEQSYEDLVPVPAAPEVQTSQVPVDQTATASAAPPPPQDQISTPAPETADQTTSAMSQIPTTPEAWGPLTDYQTKQLKQNLQNLKKGRHAISFTKPVDYVALKIPTYPDIIKNPMDLGTMEQKLKDGRYASVSDFITDFNLIVENCVTFNGPAHVVTIAAQQMKAQFQAGMRKVPKSGEVAPIQVKKGRTSSFALPARDSKPRVARTSTGGAASPTSATGQTFALGSNGVPLTRRTSNTADGRPKREIVRPPPRDLPYLSAKPKKKKYQMELKFCEHVLSEMKKGRYSHLMAPFSAPVDAVALNIPTYHKVIRKPMDFGTISEKMSSGQYENAKEFEGDVRLVFENCLKFNGANHPVSQLAKQFEDIFNTELSHKQSWIAHNAPSVADSPEFESDSEQDDDEMDEDEVEDDLESRAEQIKSIHQQIAELSAKAMALSNAPPSKKSAKKGGKASKGSSTKTHRKSGGGARAEKKAAKPKPKARPLTNREKEEIAERIGELNGEQTAKAAEQIKAGLRRIGRADLADRPDEELEFDISIIPEDILQYLFKLIRSMDGGTDYRPVSNVHSKSTVGPTKAKKSKPMGKHEQEAAIRRLQDQMKSFDAPRNDDSSPGNEDMSDDDDESGSESEEE